MDPNASIATRNDLTFTGKSEGITNANVLTAANNKSASFHIVAITKLANPTQGKMLSAQTMRLGPHASSYGSAGSIGANQSVTVRGSYGSWFYIETTGGTWAFVQKSSVLLATMTYKIYASSSLSLATMRSAMDDVAKSFAENFGIRLVRADNGTSTTTLNKKPGCLQPYHCTPSCGIKADGSDCDSYPHHGSSGYFSNVYSGSNATKAFSFIDFQPCNVSYVSGKWIHGSVNGIGGGTSILVWAGSGDRQRTTEHEISHLLGATDGYIYGTCTPGEICVMNDNVFNKWCPACRAVIMNSVYYRAPNL